MGLKCDPSLCDYCMYIGDGDFVCEELQELVIADWEPTQYNLSCARLQEKDLEFRKAMMMCDPPKSVIPMPGIKID